MKQQFIPIYSDHINKNMTNSYSEIYTSCLISHINTKDKPKNCNFVLKKLFIKLKDKHDNFYCSKNKPSRAVTELQQFYTEITNQSLASKYNLASPVYKYYVESEHCGFIMDKYKSSLLDLLNSDISLNEKFKLLDKVFELLEKLHEYCNMTHNDAHLTNFMLDNKNELKIIDFGYSKLEPSYEDKYNDFRIFFKNAREQYFKTDKEQLFEYWLNKMIRCSSYQKYLLIH